MLLIPKDTFGQNCLSIRNRMMHRCTFPAMTRSLHPVAFSIILARLPMLLPVGHVIEPKVFVGVSSGRCSIFAIAPSSRGTTMLKSASALFASYLYVPSAFHEEEIRW
jgi:hypothetical protein